MPDGSQNPVIPQVIDEAPGAGEITCYDREHFITYARLLDAEVDHADWREVVRVILRRNPEIEPRRARHCWLSHLERARWIATTGYQQLIARAATSQT
jgi:hypothetical protein